MYTAAVLSVGLQRAVVAEPMMVVSGEQAASKNLMRRAFSTTVGLALFVGTVASIIFVVLGHPLQTAVLVGLSMCGPFMQDGIRYQLLVSRGPISMLGSDAASAFAQISAMLFLSTSKQTTYPEYLCAWGACALVGPLLFGWTLITYRSIAASRGSLRRFGALRKSFGVDYLLGIVSLQGTLIVSTAVAGVAAAAALRGADTLVGPARIVLQTLPPILLRKWSHNRAARSRSLVLASMGVLVVVSMGAVCVYLVPARIGVEVMGDSWSVVQPVLPWVLLSLAPITLTTLSSLSIKSLGEGSVLVRTRTCCVPITLFAGVIGALLGGAVGAAIGSLIGSVVASAIFLFALVLLERSFMKGASL
ncbi:hypothetical protein [Gordonia terrae]|uniref:hypothetical protein n=1 Tax=Gordonia terrae TaxID=2055 RepID=UPI0012689CC4|nr:hypothetical protein [Gordonia terrae]